LFLKDAVNKRNRDDGEDLLMGLIQERAATLSESLLEGLRMPLRAVFYPLGFAVEITTNDQAILDAAGESWSYLPQRHACPTLRIRIRVVDGSGKECPRAPVVRTQQHIVSMVADADHQAICDLEAGVAVVWLSRASLEYRSYLRYHFLEAIALVLISTSYATAIHAACVSRDGHGVLLCGDSGVGKSSLAYACARAGWTYTSDDASYLLHNARHPRVIGNARQVRFRPSAADLFPEIQGRDLTSRMEGKPSIEVPTRELPGLITAEEASIHSIVFLNRRPSARSELSSLSEDVASQYFRQTIYSSEEVLRRQTEALQQLCSVAVYELRYQSFDQAIERLDELARVGRFSSVG
jgi:hypothetical protein